MAQAKTSVPKNQQLLTQQVAKLEQQLAEQENLFYQVVEEVGNGYWSYDIPSKTFSVSSGLASLLQCTDDQTLDLDFWQQFLSVGEFRTFQTQISSLQKQSSSPIIFPLTITTRNKHTELICNAKVVAWDDQKKPLSIIGVFTENPQKQNPYFRDEWLQWIVKHIPAVTVMLFDRDFRYGAYDRIDNYNSIIADSIFGKTMYEVCTPEEAAFFEPIHNRVFEGELVETEFNFHNRIYFAQFIPIYQEQKVVNGLVLAFDISASRGVEQHLILFIEQAPVAMAIFDIHMNYIAASHRWKSDYDLESEDLVGRSHYELFPNIRQDWKEIHQDCLLGNTHRKDEDYYINEKGEEQWIRWEVMPWCLPDNIVGGIIIMTEDITERKKSELSLEYYQQGLSILAQISASHQLTLEQQLKEVLSSITQYFDLPIGIISCIENQDYKVEYVISNDDEIQIEPGTIFPIENTYCSVTFAQNDTLAIQDVTESEYATHPCYKEFHLESYIGSTIWVAGKKYGTINFSSPSKRPIPFSENDVDFMRLVARWVGTTLERYTNEKQLIDAREEAEEATRAKTDFLSTMSHEIRTPMNAVVGMAHLLLEENPRKSQLESIKTLKFSADLLLSLINDILDFSKIEAGKIVLESIDFNLRDLLQGIKAAQGIKATEKQVKLKLRWDDDVPELVVGDAVRLGQIINNLVSNAVKFTDKGQVKVEVELIEEKNDQLVIGFSVQDSGIGISPEQLEVIFDEFSQASSSTTRKYGGTGLGLAITRKLLELQGSEIKVTSEVGKGSIFSFELEFSKSAKKQVKDRFNPNLPNETYWGSLNGLRVLLVEDNTVNQYVAVRFMKKWQVILDIANHGGEALEMVKKQPYDVILMDLQMPVVDGYQATKNIREWEEEHKQVPVPIIALTASASRTTKEKVNARGMNDFLAKPFDPKELFARLQYHSSVNLEQIDKEEISIPHTPVSNETEKSASLSLNQEVFDFLTDGNIVEQINLSEKLSSLVKRLIQDAEQFYQTFDQAKLAYDLHRVKSTFTMFEIEPLASVIREMSDDAEAADLRKYPDFIPFCKELLQKIEKLRPKDTE
ncbi:MAG: ATP-binding protein [Bacteroidota bacterium]